jgi:uncharacterized protein (TIGR03905 family)
MGDKQTFIFHPANVCAIVFEIDHIDGTIIEVRSQGGCQGSMMAISRLLNGRHVKDAGSLLKGILCPNNNHHTSCADQLASAFALIASGTATV